MEAWGPGGGLRARGRAARSVAFAATLGAFLPSAANALQPVSLDVGALLDQQQNVPDPAFAPFPAQVSGVNLGEFSQVRTALFQSFQPGYDTMVGASIYLLRNGAGQGNARIQVGLFDTLKGALAGGPPLRSAEARGKTGTWIEASWFDSPLHVQKDSTYVLVFSQLPGSEFFAFGGGKGDLGADPYSRGAGYEKLGSNLVPLSGVGNNVDFAFRTYAIPEPGTGILLAAGLALLGVIARRRLRG